MADPGIIFGLATLGLTVSIGILVVRITHYSKRVLELHEKTTKWLDEIEGELRDDLKKKPAIDEVLSLTGRFSSVKSMKERLEKLHSENSGSIRSNLLGVLAIIIAAIVNVTFADGLALQLVSAPTAAIWFLNVVYFYQFHNEVSGLERKTHFKKV